MNRKLILFVLILALAAGAYYFTNKHATPQKTPKIVSIAPTEATTKQTYTYALKIENFDPEKHKVELAGPSWLKLDEEFLVISGRVPEKINKFTYTVSVLDSKSGKMLDSQTVAVSVKASIAKKIIIKLTPIENQGQPAVLAATATREEQKRPTVPNTGKLPTNNLLLGILFIGLGVGLLLFPAGNNPRIKTIHGKLK